MSRWRFIVRQLTSGLWFRSLIFSAIGVIAALMAAWLSPLIPSELGGRIGADAVDNILGILASSMLAVTTFSLNIMVGAYSSATTNATPRATRLLMADPTSQNVLSTFVGVFLYSIVGIIALSTGTYGEQGRVILFGATIAVIVVTVFTLLRWIDYLSRIGRVGDTAQRVEKVALDVVEAYAKDPFRGCRNRLDFPADGNRRKLRCRTIGYIQHVDFAGLQALAERHQCRIALLSDVGTFCDPSRPVLEIAGDGDLPEDAAILQALTIGDQRSFDQDPRFAVAVLAEIGARALSAAINDIGTAIDIIGRSLRVMAAAAQPSEASEIRHDRVYVARIQADDLFDDMFTSFGRDGAAEIEVSVRLMKALASLHDLGGPDFRAASRRHALELLERCEKTLQMDSEKRALRQVYDSRFT
ncbi:DUF2254 domain-containing protein [Aureimonas altamirensis]|uniref:DUF2254 domain-containing protein n=1 Tax=Aureimonas altamirensis TaxID=370622 RepID=UPI0030165BDD